jgi:SPP1 family predicted phage head-tail adaptor
MPPIGTYRHRVTVQNPGASVPDGDGGYTEGWSDADPATLDVSITPATTSDVERLTAGTVAATATHMVRGRFHPGITLASRLIFKGRTLNVIYVGNPDERDLELVMLCAEQLTTKAGATSTPAAVAPPPQAPRRIGMTAAWSNE